MTKPPATERRDLISLIYLYPLRDGRGWMLYLVPVIVALTAYFRLGADSAPDQSRCHDERPVGQYCLGASVGGHLVSASQHLHPAAVALGEHACARTGRQ